MDLKVGMIILPSSSYNQKEFRALPITDVGGASAHVDRIRKSPFYASFWQLTSRDKRLTVASYVGSVK